MIVDVNGKVIVITGASGDIGSHIAYVMAKEGAYVVLHYHKREEKANSLFQEIHHFNPNCMLVAGDLTDEGRVKTIYDEVIAKYRHVDVLINNAGMCKDSFVSLMSFHTWREVVETNLDSSFYCSKYFSKAMIGRRSGKIINMASYKGQVGCKGQANYSASKAGMIALTKTLAKELSPFGVCVNAVCPGFIPTGLNRASPEKIARAKTQSMLAIKNNLDGLTNMLVLLASDGLSCVTGQVFNIDSRNL